MGSFVPISLIRIIYLHNQWSSKVTFYPLWQNLDIEASDKLNLGRTSWHAQSMFRPTRKCEIWVIYGYFCVDENVSCHYSGVTWTSCCLSSPTTWLLVRPFVQANIIEIQDFTLLARCEGNLLVTIEFHSHRASNTKKPVSIWWHYGASKTATWWSIGLQMSNEEIEFSWRLWGSLTVCNYNQGIRGTEYQSERMMIKKSNVMSRWIRFYVRICHIIIKTSQWWEGQCIVSLLGDWLWWAINLKIRTI